MIYCLNRNFISTFYNHYIINAERTILFTSENLSKHILDRIYYMELYFYIRSLFACRNYRKITIHHNTIHELTNCTYR